jgi:serine/threonine-protein kinase HipA
MDCHIQIFLNGRWQTAAVFEPDMKTLDRGVEGGCRIDYDYEYALANLDKRDAEIAPGFPVGFELFRFERWPPFLLDLMPGGAGRRAWLKRLQVERDSAQFDWHLLLHGAGAPPGNLRVAEAVLPPPPDCFKIGFPRRDIIEQRENFLDYAEERGAHVAGASSVQGEAPKYLLVQDYNGMFHAEGSLPDNMCAKFWLVKFPRGRRSDLLNQQVLRNEAPYLEVARAFGLRVGESLQYEDDVLFVPRFDRKIVDGQLIRTGMHSLYALAGITGYGRHVLHDTYCRVLAETATDPSQEIREYIRRDILNLALLNTDNHGRNTAVLRTDGKIELSPLFDFAPMFLDPEGIGRASRWEDERPGAQPQWEKICKKLAYVLNPEETRTWLIRQADVVKRLPETMRECHVDDVIIRRLLGRIKDVSRGLAGIGPL